MSGDLHPNLPKKLVPVWIANTRPPPTVEFDITPDYVTIYIGPSNERTEIEMSRRDVLVTPEDGRRCVRRLPHPPQAQWYFSQMDLNATLTGNVLTFSYPREKKVLGGSTA